TCCGSIPSSSVSRPGALQPCVPAGTTRPGAPRSTTLSPPRDQRRTWCRRSSGRSSPTRRSGKSRMRSAACSASTKRSMPEPLLSVDRLTTGFDSAGRFVPAVIDVSLHLDKGETLCLVGESGSGKSLTAFSIMGLVEPPGRVDRGTVLFKGRDLLRRSEREMQGIRGREMALVFQEPMTALNAVFSIGSQIEETLRVHGQATRQTARAKAIELLEAV